MPDGCAGFAWYCDIRYCEHCVWKVGTVGRISDCQPEGPRFNPRPGRGLNFGRPYFATPSVDRDIKSLVLSPDILSGDLKEPTHLSIRVG